MAIFTPMQKATTATETSPTTNIHNNISIALLRFAWNQTPHFGLMALATGISFSIMAYNFFHFYLKVYGLFYYNCRDELCLFVWKEVAVIRS